MAVFLSSHECFAQDMLVYFINLGCSKPISGLPHKLGGEQQLELMDLGLQVCGTIRYEHY